ncbi:SDR family oxidoreductase, partial [Acinetobacter baumannii]
PAMKRAGRGAIVTITSGAALQASLTGVQAYCSAKHALLGLTRQLAHEFGPHGIRVNSVAPGFVRTNAATERQWASYSTEKQRQIVESVALKR